MQWHRRLPPPLLWSLLQILRSGALLGSPPSRPRFLLTIEHPGASPPPPHHAPVPLQALSLTGPEAAVLEGALNELHGVMRSKRGQVHALEEELEVHNPAVFAAVQVRDSPLLLAALSACCLFCLPPWLPAALWPVGWRRGPFQPERSC
jgi:hypothetical protein